MTISTVRPAPATYRARAQGELLDRMARDARWRSHVTDRPWDPARADADDLPDFGRGVLDSFALGLHVLWVYQAAWGDEGFIARAQLSASVRGLLELIGYHPDPGFAASGLQHFRVKEGASTTVPPRFRVAAKADGDLDAAVFETLHALDVSASCNELRPFLPVSAIAPSTTGAIADALGPRVPFAQVPSAEVLGGPATLVDQVRDRLAAQRAGALADFNAARARQKALRVAEVLSELQEQGAVDLCGEEFDRLCEMLCETQQLANQSAEPAVGPLSESQELLLGRLASMAARQPAAIEAFQAALGQSAGESIEDWSRRLDQMTGFLDTLVASILQEARDQVVRLRGSRALSQLDRSLGPGRSDLGVAAPGTDTVFLVPIAGIGGGPPTTHSHLLRPGDWLIVGEEVEQLDANGASTSARRYHEAVQVLRVRDEVPTGWREVATRVTFTPPLTRRYRLAQTVLLGNVAEITHGSTAVTERRWEGGSSPTIDVPASPLTWRRAPADDAEGRVADIELTVAGRDWQRRTDLRGASPTDTVFAVELLPSGGSRLRVGDGREGANVPDGALLSIRARAGIGADGSRAPMKIDGLASANPSIVATFNPLAVSGGVGAEDDSIARARARAGVHALDRAISVADVRSLALSFGGVRRAGVFRDVERHRSRVRVVVLDHAGGPLEAGELDELQRFLVTRMPPGSSVSVANGTTVALRLGVVLAVEPGRDPLAVMSKARVRLGVDLEPGAPPGLLAPGRPELGADVQLSDVYAALDGIAWLKSTFVTSLHRDDEPVSRRDRVAIPPTAVPVWASTATGVEPVALAWEEWVDR